MASFHILSLNNLHYQWPILGMWYQARWSFLKYRCS